MLGLIAEKQLFDNAMNFDILWFALVIAHIKNEHEPKHVHIEKADEFAKVELATLRVVNNHMRPKELRKALSIVEDNKNTFARKWDEYFSQR